MDVPRFMQIVPAFRAQLVSPKASKGGWSGKSAKTAVGRRGQLDRVVAGARCDGGLYQVFAGSEKSPSH